VYSVGFGVVVVEGLGVGSAVVVEVEGLGVGGRVSGAGQAAMTSHPLQFVVPQFGWLTQFRAHVTRPLYMTQPLGAPFDLCTD